MAGWPSHLALYSRRVTGPRVKGGLKRGFTPIWHTMNNGRYSIVRLSQFITEALCGVSRNLGWKRGRCVPIAVSAVRF